MPTSIQRSPASQIRSQFALLRRACNAIDILQIVYFGVKFQSHVKFMTRN
jgi:hypothetical protein